MNEAGTIQSKNRQSIGMAQALGHQYIQRCKEILTKNGISARETQRTSGNDAFGQTIQEAIKGSTRTTNSRISALWRPILFDEVLLMEGCTTVSTNVLKSR